MSKTIYTTQQDVEKFLSEIQKSKTIIETTSRASLNLAIDFEQKYNKYFYDFSKQEILNMYRACESIALRSLQNKNCLLKDFAVYMGRSKKNAYTEINKENLLDCIDKKKRDSSILSRQQLTELQKELFNFTDKGILEALFLGLGDSKLKELAFFNVNHIKNKNTIVLENKNISISYEQYVILVKACCETNLISFGVTMRQSKNISHGLFKERFNALSSSSDQSEDSDLERRYRFFQRRLMLMSDYLGLNLTSGKVQESGFLHFLRINVEKSGLSFEDYIKTKEAQELANRYDIHTDLYPQIIKEKFGRYFR